MTQQYWWAPGIVSMPALSLGSGTKGGYVRVTWGQISFAPNSFGGDPPPEKADIQLDWGLISTHVLHIFDGTIYLREYTDREVRYELYEPEMDHYVLDDGTDETGQETTRPLVIGTVSYMSPQRTGTDIEQKYYMPDFAGSVGDGYDFYDDGVLINDSWTIGSEYAERSVNLVGRLSMSGTGTMKTIEDLFSWAANRMGLDYVDIHGGDTRINCAVYSQMRLVDFLDQVAYYCGYQFTIRDDVLTLIDMEKDHGDQTISEYGSVEISYEWPMPVKKYKADWSIRQFDPPTVTVIEVPKEYILNTESIVGDDEVSITVFDEEESHVKEKVDAIAARDTRVWVALSLPLDQLSNIGERINFTDRKEAHKIDGYLRVREYSLDYQGKILNIKGEGEIAFS